MKPIAKHFSLLLGVAMLALLAASLIPQNTAEAGPPPDKDVIVINTPDVNVVSHPAIEPFQSSVSVEMNFPDTQVVGSFSPPVPDGKRFVVEYVNALTFMPAGQHYRLLVGANGGQYHFTAPKIGTDFTIDPSVLSEPVKLYIDPTPLGAPFPLRLNMTRFPGNTEVAKTTVRLIGHLVDIP